MPSWTLATRAAYGGTPICLPGVPSVPGVAALALFAWLLTRIEVDAAGRAYAAYGGIYIAATIVWLWAVEQTRPDRWDIIGALVCLVGAGIILFAPHRTPG